MNTFSQEYIVGKNFIRNIIDEGIKKGKWSGRVETRFAPEPNGYLHIGHAKSMHINFGFAHDYGGVCHLRFDDTNPEKESAEYVNSIIETVKWLGFSWFKEEIEYLYYASDYFEKLYEFACFLIKSGHAYVDSQSIDIIRASRGSLTEPGIPSPHRDREPLESLNLFNRMRAGEFNDGEYVLRARIDMGSPNINMRDPIIYRIRHVSHHRTLDKWYVYPMYDFTHCVSDALENITHSLCTLEFENHRPLYNWFLDKLIQAGALSRPIPEQIEFSRLRVTYTITSKRKLVQLINEGFVDSWDDPRLPTIIGLRRRGYTSSSIRLFCNRIGISKSDSWIAMDILEQALRDDLNPTAPRAIAVLNPLKLIIENFPETGRELCKAPVHPHDPKRGQREFFLTRELWIEREDFLECPKKGYFRLFPGGRVRLRYGFVIECIKVDKDCNGKIVAIRCNYLKDSKSGTKGSNSYKVKGNIHWVSVCDSISAEIRLYEKLFIEPHPDEGNQNFKKIINPNSRNILQAYVEPSVKNLHSEVRIQFERHGYFVTDMKDSKPDHLVFNRAVSLRENRKK